MSTEQKPHITPSLDGPYWATDFTRFANRSGPIRIRQTMALCRCGGSANMPFCDGAHVKMGFRSTNSPAAIRGRRENHAGVEHRDSECEPAIFVARNGPYVVTGEAELRNTIHPDGSSTEHFALCRCGGSNHKPFCDGTHREIGFEDEKN